MAATTYYNLGYSTDERLRLLVQHESLINIVGYTIHPEIRGCLPAHELHIAELATGTGIFLKTIAAELPGDTTLHGYDISEQSFLSASELPSNVTLSVLNAKKPAPAYMQNKYDVVFIRYINPAMQPEEWSLVARTAFDMLKPGGAVQWCEATFTQFEYVFSPDPSVKTDAIEHMVRSGLLMSPDLGWGPKVLQRTLDLVGFKDVQVHRTSTDRRPEDRALTTQLNVTASYHIVKTAIMRGSHPAFSHLPTVEELDATFEKAKMQVANGAYNRCDVIVWIGRKPVE